jgi:hypothetical protein
MRRSDTARSGTKRAAPRREIAGFGSLTAFADLMVVTAGAVACAAFVAVPWLRIPSGLLLVLVFPGYAVAALILPDRPARTGTSGVLWRGMWTVGLSLAVAVFAGLLLNLAPVGLTRLTWTISLTAITLIASVASSFGRSRHQPPQTSRTPSSRAGAWIVAGYTAGAVAFAGAAVGLAMASVGWQHSPGFAQLWLVPARGTTASEPDVSGHVALSVRSQYRGAETFHLVLLRGTSTVGTWDFRLDAGQSWERDVTAVAGQRLTARLTTVGEPSGTQSVAVTSS